MGDGDAGGVACAPGLDVLLGTDGLAAGAPCRGFGIVRFPNKEAAEEAVEKMNNATIGGRVVSVRIDRFA